MILRNLFKNSLNILTEAHVKHLIRLIKHDSLDVLKTQCMSSHVIHDTSRSSDNNRDITLE